MTQVSCGASHTLVLTRDREAWFDGCYRGNSGKLPFPDDFWLCPTSVSHGSCRLLYRDVLQIASGQNHSLLLTKQNVMECGALFDDNVEKQERKLPEETKWIAAGGYSSALLAHSGELYTWGLNNYGQCGIPWSTLSQYVTDPQRLYLPTRADISTICFSPWHALLLTSDGLVYVAGKGHNGCLGLGREKLVCDEGMVLLAALRDKCQDITAGEEHSLALTRDGDVFGWGGNRFRTIVGNHQRRFLV